MRHSLPLIPVMNCAGQISFPSVFYFRYFCLFVFMILLPPTQYFFAQKASNCPVLASISRPLWSNSDDDLIFESQLAREWWWSHTTLWGGDIWMIRWSMEPTSDQPLFLERPSRVPCVSILTCVYISYICFWAGKFGSFKWVFGEWNAMIL